MPRGVYDRSKFKKAAKTEEVGKIKTAKRIGKVRELLVEKVDAKEESAPQVGLATGTMGHRDLYTIRENLAALTNTRASVIGPIGDPYTTTPANGSTRAILITKLDTLITKIVDQFDAALFPVEKVAAPVEEIPAPKTNGAAVPAPVAQAPVAFNPPTFAPQS